MSTRGGDSCLSIDFIKTRLVLGESEEFSKFDLVTDLNNMNKRGDAFQQQFNRAVFAASGAGMLPSVTSQPNEHKDGNKKNKTWSAKPQRRIATFKCSDQHDSGRASPSAGELELVVLLLDII